MTPTPTRMAQWLESAWLARYLERQLSEEESAWFEGYVLDKPQLLGAIDADSRLRDALDAKARAGTEWREGGSAPDGPASAGARRPSSLRWGAMAASLIIGFGAATLVSRLRNPAADSGVIGSSGHIFIDLQRGIDISPKNAPNSENENNPEGNIGGSNYIVLDVAVPQGSTNVKLLIDHREVSSIESAKDGDATFVLQRALIASRPAVQVSFESEGRTELRQLPIDVLLRTNSGR